MQEITDYKILKGAVFTKPLKSQTWLETTVREHLMLGWQPLGGICGPLDSFNTYCQAMVKYEERGPSTFKE